MAQSSTSSHDEIIAAITDFYKFYIRLPYLDSNALVFAPENTGWPSVNATELRNRGRSDEAIELLRHLPYLDNPSIRGGWTIDDGSDCIQYHKGACYNNNPDLIKSLPAHIIPIANPTDREGRYLLLDVQTGNVTSYNVLANNIEGNWEKLIWMVAPAIDDSHGDGGTYFTRVDNVIEENELLENDDHDGDIEIDDEVTKVWFTLNP
jgi:hypothetical protein